MKTILRLRVPALLLAVTLLAGLLCFTACSSKGETLLELEGHTISVNEYRFLLSRVKGSLAYSCYSVDSDSFWEMIVDKDGTTYDEYFRQAALTDARRYLAALVLFEEQGLKLPDSVLDGIEEDIEESIRDAGGKSALNSELAAYGINIDMLRDIYIMEAKYSYLQADLYGQDGDKIAAEVRHDYLEEYAVCFRQVLIRSYDYVYEKDSNGDTVYYLPKENNAKVNNIAYDTIKGSVRLDEYGKVIKDSNGDDIYYLEDGKIAYDTEKGVRAIKYDKAGNPQTVKYSAEELAAHKEAAEEILASVEKGDYLAFEALLEEYATSGDDAFETDGSYCFLYNTGDNTYDYLNDIADTLTKAEMGTVHMISSEYGYNVVMKYEIPEDAVTNEAYEDWFTDLSARVIAKLFHTKCLPYMDKVTVNNEAFAALPSMKEIGTNYNY